MRKRRLGGVLVLGTALVLSACGGGGESADDATTDAGGDDPAAAETTEDSSGGEPFLVGSTLPLTSAVSDQAEQLRNGYELAISEANANGGVCDGRQIELVVEDDQFDAARAKELTRNLIAEDGVQALLGSFGSAPSLTQSAEAEQQGIPGVYPFASVSEMVDRGFENVFNLYPLSVDAEHAMDTYLIEDVQPESVAILYADNPFSISGAEASKTELEGNDVQVPVFEKYALDTADFISFVTKAEQSGVDVIKNIGYANHHVALMQAASQVAPDVDVIYSETQIPFEVRSRETLGDAANLALGQPYWYQGATPDLEAKLTEEYGGTPEIQAVFGYSAAQVMIDAIERSECGGPDALREELAATDLETPMGQISFDERGAYQRDFRIAQLQGDDVVTLWPSEEADGELVPWSEGS